MKNLKRALVYINPMFFYYSLIYVTSKVIQYIFNTESFWQLTWNRIIEIFGDDMETYSVWLLNTYTYILYWTFGITLLLMEYFNFPKGLKNYKIQQESIDFNNKGQLSRVRISAVFESRLTCLLSSLLSVIQRSYFQPTDRIFACILYSPSVQSFKANFFACSSKPP